VYFSAQLLILSRVILALVGIGLCFGYHLYYARAGRLQRRAYSAILAVAALLSVYLYLEIGPQFRKTDPLRLMNAHDFFHYYVGSKYHAELGYYAMYECSVVADAETGRRLRPEWTVRDLKTYGMKRVSGVLADPDACKRRFEPERWREFKADVAALSEGMAPTRWNVVLQDKGYNATPVWTLWARALTGLLPLSRGGVLALLSLDWLFMLAVFVAVGRTFGRQAALLLMLFWGANVMTSFGFVKGSVSRLDWLACLILALCALRKGRYGWAGALAGIATALRIFPALFFAGLAFKAVHELIRTRRVPARYLRFGAAFAVVAVLLAGATALTGQGRRSWPDFAEKIATHDSYLAGYRVGMKYAVIDDQAASSKVEAARSLDSRRAVLWAARLLALAAVFVVARRLPDDRTLGLSFLCVFFLASPTFYYYQMLAVPFLLFLPDEREPRRALGSAAFFAWCVVGYWLAEMYPLGLPLSRLLSWSLVVLCALIAALAREKKDMKALEV
jgi:hypothetical protein